MTHWVSECIDIVRARAGDVNCKRWVGELGRVKRRGYSTATIKAHLREYLYQTPVQYISPSTFRANFDGLNPDKAHAHRIDRKLDQCQKKKQSSSAHRKPSAATTQDITMDLFRDSG